MLCPTDDTQTWLLEQFAQFGVASERVEFAPFLERRHYMDAYRQLDVILDTFPYNGHMTTCDALWMGVPVISLAGKMPVSRGGLSLLSNVGLPKLVGFSEEEYVRTALELASDLPRLAALRGSLRARTRASPLMDAPRFTRGVEAAFRTMWRIWGQEGEATGVREVAQ
jgi:predicted O-linked N-acetylglucosamine transferase (SPINDLY family)